jgi:citrate lyase subunit beta / citryl-CoA lyase
VRDADAARAVGYTFTPEGLETLYIRSRVVLESRAAGLEHPICGLWQDIGDLDGLRRFAEQNRGLGYRGQLVIHPSHVPVVTEVFGISASEISFYRGMISAFDAAVAEGRAAVEYAGQHIDYAHVKTAREKLRLSDSAAEPTSH